MRHIPGLYWFPILCWIFVSIWGLVLMEVPDSRTKKINHPHTRRKSIISRPQHSHGQQENLISNIEHTESTLEDLYAISSATTTASAITNHFFISPNYTIVQAQTLTTAILHCEISDLGNSTVTWKRRRDYQILTFGLLTYSSDVRFFTRNIKHEKDWSLHIRYVNIGDAGLYECQISSHPPISIFVELHLLEAHAEILGGPDKVVQAGSTLLLTCIVRRCTEIPEYIFWYHEERMINYDHHVTSLHRNYYNMESSGGFLEADKQTTQTKSIVVDEENNVGNSVLGFEDETVMKLISGMVRHHKQSSELLIANASERHSGNYSCVPSKAKPSSVTVHVLRVEKPAAMQHNKNCIAKVSTNHLVFLLTPSLNFFR